MIEGKVPCAVAVIKKDSKCNNRIQDDKESEAYKEIIQ